MVDEETQGVSIVLKYVSSLDASIQRHLLDKPACALFFFRMLPATAQQLLIKLVWNSNVSSILRNSIDNKELSMSIRLLQDLSMISMHGDIMKVDSNFRKSYLRSTMMGCDGCAGMSFTDLDEKKKQKDLNKKAQERWECILKYLALPSEQNRASVSDTTRKLFNAAGFTSEGGSDVDITSAGFQFLLFSPVEQLWTYLIEYMKLTAREGHDIVQLLEVLIRVVLLVQKGDSQARRAYEFKEEWPKAWLEMLMHLREMGLIFIRKRKDGVFFLTPLLVNLSVSGAGEEELASSERKNGTIIVETNFRLYAYTSSSLQLAILSAFTEMTYRFNDMSVGILTRESVRRALQVGITAAQIISFLRTNAHPQCLASSGPLNCLPVTVSDQIRLWEDERKRLTYTASTLYSNFESEEEFSGLCAFAQRLDILLWADSTQKLVIVTEAGHERVKEWWKNKRQHS